MVFQHFSPLGFDFPTLASLKQNISYSSQLEWRVLKSSENHSYAVGSSVVAVVSGYLFCCYTLTLMMPRALDKQLHQTGSCITTQNFPAQI